MQAHSKVYEPDDYGDSPCSLPSGPAVTMTLAEAEALSFALAKARARLRGLIAGVERRTFEDRTIYDQREVVEIRAQLDALDEFHRCHCKAWWPRAT